MGLRSLRGLRRSHFSPSAICFPVYKVEMIIITVTALFILDDGLHEHEDFYRLHSTCVGNITFEPILSRLPASAHEAQTPAPTGHPPNKSRFEYETLKHGCAGAERGSAVSPVVPLPAVSSGAAGSGVCFLALVLRRPDIQQTLAVCKQDTQFCPSPQARRPSQAMAAPVNL